jgi:hypothetical protein
VCVRAGIPLSQGFQRPIVFLRVTRCMRGQVRDVGEADFKTLATGGLVIVSCLPSQVKWNMVDSIITRGLSQLVYSYLSLDLFDASFAAPANGLVPTSAAILSKLTSSLTYSTKSKLTIQYVEVDTPICSLQPL